jgi:hypothetical protein
MPYCQRQIRAGICAARGPNREYRLAVVIEVRRNVPLGVREKRAVVVVPTPKPPPGTAFPPRRLTLRGVPIFELGLWCGTCPALFKKLNQPESADLGLANERLNEGLNTVDDAVLRAYGKVLPKSTTRHFFSTSRLNS